jgi:FAD/FMN-containing dehydrogenase
MIDLSVMKGIHVGPVRRIARAEGGCNWGDFDRATRVYGLATTGGGVSSTGIAGLTMGGGYGWIMGACGLTCDNLIGAQVVTAQGEVIEVTLESHPDLLWALRGGGGNFGVVTAFVYTLHPVGPEVYSGRVSFPFARAKEILPFYREFTSRAPDDLMAYSYLAHHPQTGEKVVGLSICHLGDDEAIEADLRPLRQLGSPAFTTLGPMQYVDLQTMQDPGFPHGNRHYWKSSFMPGLPDGAIDAMVDAYERVPSTRTAVGLELFHGQVLNAPEGGSAYSYRTPGFNMLIVSQWEDPAADDANVRWTREAYAAMNPYIGQGRYGNYLTEDEVGDAPAAQVFGTSMERLVEIKTKYDPHNLFHHNVNIRPATVEPVTAA